MNSNKQFIIGMIITLIILAFLPFGCALQKHYLDNFNIYIEDNK